MPTKKKPSSRPPRARPVASDALRPEYDFSAGVRGKYAARYPKGGLVVTLDPDVATAYPSAAAVNAALRTLLKPSPRAPARKRSA